MRKRAFALALAFALLVPVVSRAGADSDALLQFGLIGHWAFDCQKPPSPANPFINFNFTGSGQPTRQIITGKPEIDSRVPLSNVTILDALHLRLSYPQGGVTVTVTLLMELGRVRPYEAIASDGTVSVSGGNVTATGQPTNWLLKCPD
ncbi:MAG TPA: hypothetical protein VN728_14130 [Stellaceae bacterium]|jgi:hypothetical protein|nr:hypothetical protein [Stellaceae bacterium]